MKWVAKVRRGSGNATAIRYGWREGLWHVTWIIFRTYPVRITRVQAPLYSGGCSEHRLESVCFIAAFSVTVWYKTPVLESFKIQTKLVRSYPCFSATTPSAKPSVKWIYRKHVTTFWHDLLLSHAQWHRGGNIHLPVPPGEVSCGISGEDKWGPLS